MAIFSKIHNLPKGKGMAISAFWLEPLLNSIHLLYTFWQHWSLPYNCSRFCPSWALTYSKWFLAASAIALVGVERKIVKAFFLSFFSSQCAREKFLSTDDPSQAVKVIDIPLGSLLILAWWKISKVITTGPPL